MSQLALPFFVKQALIILRVQNFSKTAIRHTIATPYPFSHSLPFILLRPLLCSFMVTVFAGNFYQDFDITWGDGRGKILNNGQLLTLTLDKASGSGFQSKNHYLFGKIDMQIKLVPGNSAGIVTAYYLRSEGSSWDELDFEFLGNLSGDPYIVHTNVYTQGKGDREQQFYLWFDPTADFHTYSVLWNPQHTVLYVDGTPLREFRNLESIGVKYPKNQPMKISSGLWNADDWATRGVVLSRLIGAKLLLLLRTGTSMMINLVFGHLGLPLATQNQSPMVQVFCFLRNWIPVANRGFNGCRKTT